MMKCSQVATRLIASVAICFAFGAQSAIAAGLYKWTDDKGAVHYSDQMPPDAVNKGTTVFDKQGRPVKKIDAAPTPEQLKAKEQDDERQKAAARQRDDQARKDMALLQTYTNESEIELARNRAVSAVAVQIKSAETYTADLTRRQQEIEKQKAALAGKPMTPALETELSSLNDELGRQGRLLAQKKDELANINARYDVDKRRWQEIKADQARAAAAAIEPPAKQTTKSAANPPATVTK
jgi:Domain of unknown function (DUF4124)